MSPQRESNARRVVGEIYILVFNRVEIDKALRLSGTNISAFPCS